MHSTKKTLSTKRGKKKQGKKKRQPKSQSLSIFPAISPLMLSDCSPIHQYTLLFPPKYSSIVPDNLAVSAVGQLYPAPPQTRKHPNPTTPNRTDYSEACAPSVPYTEAEGWQEHAVEKIARAVGEQAIRLRRPTWRSFSSGSRSIPG